MKASLYVHVPFCTAKCDYCDFYSVESFSQETVSRYIDALHRQLSWAADTFQIDGFSTVYIGGGTPSVLKPQTLEQLFQLLGIFGAESSTEWTVELNPETLTPEHIPVLEASPVSRLSLGIQSFYSPSRRFLGRRGRVEAAVAALEMLGKRWGGSLSVDLIRGLPREYSLPLADELVCLPLHAVDHISLYDLTLEERTPLAARRGVRELLSGDRLACDDLPAALEAEGFLQYEVSNYALEGKESRHNRAYWEMDPYLGLGPAAVSMLPLKNGFRRYAAHPDLEEYITQGPEHYLDIEETTKTEFFMEHLIMGLRQTRGVSLSRIRERFGLEPSAMIPDTLAEWESRGGLAVENGRLRLTQDSFWYQNGFFRAAWEELDRRAAFA